MTGKIVNAFSVDVEGFVESNIQSFHIPSKYIDAQKENYEIQKNIEAVLELLNNYNTKGTFFILGRLARDIPQVVSQIAQQGHEIACHSFEHKRIFDMTEQAFFERLSYAKKLLEDSSGQSVYGFRAPDFSITTKSKWAMDVIKKIGFIYDSSIYPISTHDVYGIKETLPYIHKLPNDLIEVPMSTISIFGKRIQFGGGGYFRLYPLWLTKLLVKKINRKSHPVIFYIHPYEVGSNLPKIKEISAYRKFRHYFHCKNGAHRLKPVLAKYSFAPIIDIIKHSDLASDLHL